MTGDLVSWTIAIIVLGAVCLIEILIHVGFALLIIPIFERKLTFTDEVAEPDPSAERISFPTTHGLTLRGSLHRCPAGSSRGLIVFCPETDGSHWTCRWYAQGLMQAGFDVLAFDFRNQGESDAMPGYDPRHWLTEYEVADALAAVEYVSRRDDLKALPLGLMGISRGGGAAMAAAARWPRVRCVYGEGVWDVIDLLSHFVLRWASLYVPPWVLKPVPHWHFFLTFSTVTQISRFRRNCRYTRLKQLIGKLRDRRVMFVAGSHDSYVPSAISQMLYERLGTPAAQFHVVNKAKHNKSRRVNPEDYDRRLVEFFSALSAAGPAPANVERVMENAEG